MARKKNQTVIRVIELSHLVIYLLMVSAVVLTLIAGLTGYAGWPLYAAILLLILEGGVLMTNGWRCPLTALAKKYGAEKGYVFNALMSERAARYTLKAYVILFVIGLALVINNWLGGVD